MNYFAVTATRMDQGEVTHVLLRPLDTEPKNMNTLIALRQGEIVSVAVVVKRIRSGDTVYLGTPNVDRGHVDLATVTQLQVRSGPTPQLISSPLEALHQLSRISPAL